MNKKTEDLMNEIVLGGNISEYIDENQDEFLDITLTDYLKQLLNDAGLRVSQVAELSNKGEYIYQVFRGIKNPSRDVLISIGLAMSLTVDEAKQLLRVARVSTLDARNRRDSILAFAFNKKLSVADTNDVLYEFGEPLL